MTARAALAEPAAKASSPSAVARAFRKPAAQQGRGVGGSELGAVARGRMVPLQAKLEVGPVDDPLEHEADRVARQVMRMPASGTPPARCACGGTPAPDGECAACRAKRLERVATGAEAPGSHHAPPSVHVTLASPGRALDATTRAFFEPRLGVDLGAVRIHDDGRAAASAQDVAAHRLHRRTRHRRGEALPAGERRWTQLDRPRTHPCDPAGRRYPSRSGQRAFTRPPNAAASPFGTNYR